MIVLQPLCCVGLLLTGLAATTPGPGGEPWSDPQRPEERARALVQRMTLKEKTGQMMNDAPAIPRLGIPSYNWWSEGLHGIARSGYATLFPQAIGLAATWDQALMADVGAVVGQEARAKYNDAQRHGNHDIFYGLTIWSPNVNILRDPRWGRGQETYGEDPFLTGRLAVGFIHGLQGEGQKYDLTIATPKHFAVHSGPESDRHHQDVQPSPYDLSDTYLPAFRASVVEGHAGSLMCAYNAIHGTPACGNKVLLHDLLRGLWGFKGFVTSDCGAVDDFYRPSGHAYSADAEHAAAAAVLAGTDTNCGTTYKALLGAVQHGLLKESDLDVSLLRLFTARLKLGMFGGVRDPYLGETLSVVNNAAHRQHALQAARESIVLLSNPHAMLPLKAGAHRILVVGPNAVSLSSLEGNYNAIPRGPVMPLDGIRASFPSANVVYTQGAPFVDGVALPAPRTLFPEGLRGEYFASANLSGTAVITRIDPQLDFDWTAAAPVDGQKPEAFSVRWTGQIRVPEAGRYAFSVGFPECYPCQDREMFRVYLDEYLVGSSEPQEGVIERKPESAAFDLMFTDTKPHALRIEYRHQGRRFGAGFRLDWVPPTETLAKEAVASAQEADVVVAVVGLSPLLEGEEMPVKIQGFAGGDKTTLDLPQAQQRLLEALKATGKPLIVVLMNGSALAVDWAARNADAVLEAWYPGEAGGTALGEVLSGVCNPAGRLPMTFYRSVDDLPAFSDYAMKGRTYRYFQGEPLFGFGFGLSYSRFSYTVNMPRGLNAGEPLYIQAEVRNDGELDGDEVVEVYVTPPPSVLHAQHYLAAFTRVHLHAGETRSVKLTVEPRALSLVDARGERAVEPGEYRVFVGGSQPSKGQAGKALTVTGRLPLPR